jgi:hypothetical protein
MTTSDGAKDETSDAVEQRPKWAPEGWEQWDQERRTIWRRDFQLNEAVRLATEARRQVEERDQVIEELRFERDGAVGALRRQQIAGTEIIVGGIYEDCGFHPILCIRTLGESDEMHGISLIDGSMRTCSMIHCGVEPLTIEQVLSIREDFKGHVARRSAGGDMPNGD